MIDSPKFQPRLVRRLERSAAVARSPDAQRRRGRRPALRGGSGYGARRGHTPGPMLHSQPKRRGSHRREEPVEAGHGFCGPYAGAHVRALRLRSGERFLFGRRPPSPGTATDGRLDATGDY